MVQDHPHRPATQTKGWGQSASVLQVMRLQPSPLQDESFLPQLEQDKILKTRAKKQK
jgi:hypothetical protein